MRKGSLGVVVPGHMIVTAAHVIRWNSEEDNMLEDHLEIIQAGKQELIVQLLAVEPVADIAALGMVDEQEASAAADAFKAFCKSIAPVPILTADFPPLKPFPVHILTHLGRWVDAQALQGRLGAPNLFIRATEDIPGGTSGGPVVTDDGLLVGVVSTAGGPVGKPQTEVKAPRPHLTIPGWLIRTMLDPDWES